MWGAIITSIVYIVCFGLTPTRPNWPISVEGHTTLLPNVVHCIPMMTNVKRVYLKKEKNERQTGRKAWAFFAGNAVIY